MNLLNNSRTSFYIVVDANDFIQEVIGNPSEIVRIPLGKMTKELSQLIDSNIYPYIRRILDDSRKSNSEESSGIFSHLRGSERIYLQVRVMPITPTSPGLKSLFCIHILEFEFTDFSGIYEFQNSSNYNEEAQLQIKILKDELSKTRESLADYINQLENTNKKLKLTNDELTYATSRYQNLNEQLEASNEELRVSNEELHNAYAEVTTLNNQLKFKQEEIKRKEETLRAMVDNVPGVIFSAIFPDPENFLFTYISPKITTEFRIPIDSAYELGHDALPIHPEDLKDWKDNLKESFLFGRSLHHRGRFLYSDGRIEYWRIDASVQKLSDVHVVFDGVLMNITKQVEQEQYNEKLRNEFKHTVTNVIAVVYKLKRLDNGEYQYVFNDGFIGETLGITTSRVAGKTLEAVVGSDEATKLRQEYDRAFYNGAIEVEFTFRDRWYYSRILPYFENGIKVGVIGSAIDITEKKHFENRFLQSQKMETIGYLAGGIAHDLNNMLQPIFIYGNLLQESISMKESNQSELEMIDKILTSVSRSKKLVSQILDFSRNKKFSDDKKEPIPLLKSLEENLNLLLIDVPNHIQQIIEIDLSRDHHILIDPVKFTQVLMNLTNNAIYAMKDLSRGKLILRAYCISEKPDDWDSDLKPSHYEGFIVSVQDTGIGIEDHKIKNIFEPFFTEKVAGEGLGLGLSIVYGIMESIDGSIDVQSSVNLGTRFRLFFPIHRAANDPIEILKTSNLIKNDDFIKNQSGSILLIDDDNFTRESIEDLLDIKGIDYYSFENPRQGVDFFHSKSEKIDLIITDYKMPGITGVELIEEIRLIDESVPIIIYSGNTLPIQDEFLKKNSVTLLEKPLDVDILLRNIFSLTQKNE